MSQTTLTRRGFVGVAGSAALGMSAVAAGMALADESSQSAHTYADTVKWDAEYDVVVLGMGFAGMMSAMTAADEGAAVLLCEKMDEGEAGGNSKVCGQGFAWAQGDAEGAYKYYSALAGGREVPDDVIRALSDGVACSGDVIASFGLSPEEFVPAPTEKGYDPEYPEFEGGENINQFYAHQGSSDSYVYQHVKGIIANDYAGKIDVWFETPGIELIQDPVSGAIIGVTVNRKGEARNVRALNGVCVCTGGFEDDREMVQTYLNLINYAPVGGLYNTGDGIKMCQAVGAKLWHMSAYEGVFGLLSCGYCVPEGVPAAVGGIETSTKGAMNTGATIVVGMWGKRFGDESYTPRHGHMPDGNGLWENPHFPEKIWVIWDKTQMDTINEAGTFKEDYRDQVIECATIADIVAATGCKEDVLTKTFEDFNEYATNGEDREFGRDPSYMRAFDGEAYFVMPVKPFLLNTQGGPERNANAEILDLEGNPIPHLYSAGEMGGSTSCMYQSGTNVAECLTFGKIAGRNAAQAKDALPAYEAPAVVESTPAHLGDETDLVAE